MLHSPRKLVTALALCFVGSSFAQEGPKPEPKHDTSDELRTIPPKEVKDKEKKVKPLREVPKLEHTKKAKKAKKKKK